MHAIRATGKGALQKLTKGEHNIQCVNNFLYLRSLIISNNNIGEVKRQIFINNKCYHGLLKNQNKMPNTQNINKMGTHIWIWNMDPL